jgi:hypothetical protein
MQTLWQSALLILSIFILLQLHILNDIYLNCFNIKEREEARVRGMVIGQTNLMGNKSSRKVGSEPMAVSVGQDYYVAPWHLVSVRLAYYTSFTLD